MVNKLMLAGLLLKDSTILKVSSIGIATTPDEYLTEDSWERVEEVVRAIDDKLSELIIIMMTKGKTEELSEEDKEMLRVYKESISN